MELRKRNGRGLPSSLDLSEILKHSGKHRNIQFPKTVCVDRTQLGASLRPTVLIAGGHAGPRQFSGTADRGSRHVDFKSAMLPPDGSVPIGVGGL